MGGHVRGRRGEGVCEIVPGPGEGPVWHCGLPRDLQERGEEVLEGLRRVCLPEPPARPKPYASFVMLKKKRGGFREGAEL